ncbi:MAG TPA: hypothetical protein DCE44_23785, partial [Verrucomicrobiales bacterium]|nr:hypothetical protein [Verrucomicrobiales bacterium]
MRKVLFIAHFFPPIGGAGVQRPVKFVKHLSSFGLDPVVLTEEAQPGSRWKPEDLSLLADIRSETVVHRTVWSVPPPGSPPRTIREARYAAYLDAGAHLIQTHRPDVIFVTMSPFGDARIAAALAHQFRIPWVADLRDPWALDEVQIYRSRWHRRRERLLMQHSLASAASIILNTPEAATRFRQSFPQLAERARVSITNGYDVEDFRGPTPSNSPTQFTIIHSGYLHTDIGLHQCRNWWLYQCLGRIEKGIEILPRSHFYLMQALERWLQEDPTIHNTVRLVLIGVTSRADRELVHNSSARELVEFIGYQPHAECVRRIETADVLF